MGFLEGAGNSNWRNVKNWIDAGWNTYYKRTEPGPFSQFETILRPTTGSDSLTVFIRVWKKWGVGNEELDVNLDSITLENLGIPEPKPKRTALRD